MSTNLVQHSSVQPAHLLSSTSAIMQITGFDIPLTIMKINFTLDLKRGVGSVCNHQTQMSLNLMVKLDW